MTQTRLTERLVRMEAKNLKTSEDTVQIIVQIGQVYCILNENDDIYFSGGELSFQVELADVRYITVDERKDGRKQLSVGFGLLTDRYSFLYFTI